MIKIYLNDFGEPVIELNEDTSITKEQLAELYDLAQRIFA